MDYTPPPSDRDSSPSTPPLRVPAAMKRASNKRLLPKPATPGQAASTIRLVDKSPASKLPNAVGAPAGAGNESSGPGSDDNSRIPRKSSTKTKAKPAQVSKTPRVNGTAPSSDMKEEGASLVPPETRLDSVGDVGAHATETEDRNGDGDYAKTKTNNAPANDVNKEVADTPRVCLPELSDDADVNWVTHDRENGEGHRTAGEAVDKGNCTQKESGQETGGIRFAPWNVPVRRRLQTVAVILHSLSIAGLVSVFFFLCAIPLTWPILIPYLLHMLISNAATDGKLRFRSERFRHMRAWRFFADYFPTQLHKTHDLPATRKYIFGYHPHGIISHGAFAAFATEACHFSEKFPGITNSLLTLDSNFRIPLYRDYILAMGLRSVSKESIGNILTKGGPNGEGMGRAVTIVVGGARESLEAQPGTMHLILKERKGFIKLALRTGADLVPVLAFGENDLYDQVSPRAHPSIHRLQMFVLRTLKFTLPFLHGRGIFNYDVGLMPYRRPLNIVVGKPIKVAQASNSNNIDAAEVDRLHGLYVAELLQIWETYKDEFAVDRKEELKLFS